MESRNQNQNKDVENLLSTYNNIIEEIVPNDSKVNLIQDGKNIQIPVVYSLDKQDRSVIPTFKPPKTKEQYLADLMNTYENEIRPQFEQWNELEEVFKIDQFQVISEVALLYLDEVKDTSGKQQFFKKELDKIYDNTIHKSMEISNLQPSQNPLISTPLLDPLTGKLKEFNYREEKQQKVINNQSQKLSTFQEIDEILKEVQNPLDLPEVQIDQQNEKDKNYYELIKDQLNKLQKYEPDTNDFANQNEIRLDQIIHQKSKKQEVQQSEQEEEKIDTAIENGVSTQNDTPIEDAGQDEVDLIIQDSQAYKEAIQHAQESKGTQVVQTKFHHAKEQQLLDEMTQQSWTEIDKISMKNFKEMMPELAINYDFELDDFQKRAIYRLEQGNCVFVAAHTSAGKTVVAEYAIALSMKHMTKAIFTSPLKALSNQKYREFKEKFQEVGISTGDVSLNKNASCVIMTTEILLQMLYNDSEYLQDVEWVIFDEVHYINDEERGSVWEEVLMKLPDHINIVMLSATVPNYKEFADWVGRTKKKKVFVQCTEMRPVPLKHYFLFKEKLHLIKNEKNEVQHETMKYVINQVFEEKRKEKIQKEQKSKKKDQNKEDEKEIDFKEKAIKAKEKGINKVISNAMKKGGGDKKNSGKQNNKIKFLKFFKSLKTIQKQELLPCVVFSFSRAQCEDLALAIDESVNYTTGQEKGEIKKFLKLKLQRLNEYDRDLPQIITLRSLLVRGIGVHHAGMLPIVREMVEILFQDGYLRVVFATTTFAIGLNMPARSVLFTNTFKFNGETKAMVQSSEYLQMAGRAGRRGKDSSGSSIIYLDMSFGMIPNFQEMLDLFEDKGQPLESKLKLSYKMILNVVKQEDMNIIDLLKVSFFENESEKERMQATVEASNLQLKIQKAQQIDCIFGVPEHVHQYYSIYEQICQANNNINLITYKNSIFPLCIVEILTPKFFQEKAVVLKNNDETNQYLCLFIKDNYEEQIGYEDEEDQENTSIARSPIKKFGYEKQTYYEYVWVTIGQISKVYKNMIENVFRIQVVKDTLPPKSLKDIISEFRKIKQFQEFPQNKQAQKFVEQREQQFQLLPTLKCHDCNYRRKHLTQTQVLNQSQKRLNSLKSLMSSSGQQKLDDFKSKVQVLIAFKYIDYDMNLQYKGRVAKEIQNVDKILMTELLFSGHLKNLTNEEMLSLFSVLSPQIKAAKAEECTTEISGQFVQALNFVQTACEELIQIEQKYGVIDEESDPTKRLNFYFYEIIHAWANQKKFIEIVQLNDINEGIIIKMVMQIQQICKSLQLAAKVIGDATLVQKLEQANELITRDIIFTQSLYLE